MQVVQCPAICKTLLSSNPSHEKHLPKWRTENAIEKSFMDHSCRFHRTEDEADRGTSLDEIRTKDNGDVDTEIPERLLEYRAYDKSRSYKAAGTEPGS